MIATSIDTLSLPSVWYPVVAQIQAFDRPPKPHFEPAWGNRLGYMIGSSTTVISLLASHNRIEQLGWSDVEALETHLRFRSFAEDWDAPGMEAYDDL